LAQKASHMDTWLRLKQHDQAVYFKGKHDLFPALNSFDQGNIMLNKTKWLQVKRSNHHRKQEKKQIKKKKEKKRQKCFCTTKLIMWLLLRLTHVSHWLEYIHTHSHKQTRTRIFNHPPAPALVAGVGVAAAPPSVVAAEASVAGAGVAKASEVHTNPRMETSRERWGYKD